MFPCARSASSSDREPKKLGCRTLRSPGGLASLPDGTGTRDWASGSDLQTLVRICRVLNATPNEMLGFTEGRSSRRRTERDKLIDRLMTTANVLDDGQLKLAVRQVEAIVTP